MHVLSDMRWKRYAAALAATMGATVVSAGVASATVPAGFQSSSTSWLSPTTGVVLGYTPCPRTTWCPALLATTDAGHTWQQLPPPPVPLPDNGNQVKIQVIDRQTALVDDGNHIEITHDQARHWSPVTIPGFPANGFLDRLAVGHGKVFAVGTTFGPGGATTLYSGSLYGSTLAPVPGLTVTGQGFSYGDASTRGGVVQVRLGADLATSSYWTSADGTTFRTAPDPCPATNSTRLGGIVGPKVIALCVGDGGDPQPGENPKQWTSAPGVDQPFTLGGQAPFPGETQDFAVASPDSATIGSASAAFFLFSTFDGGNTWTNTLTDDQDRGGVLSDLAFVTPTVGFVQVGSPNTFGMAPVVYRTTDGGHTWHPFPTFPTIS